MMIYVWHWKCQNWAASWGIVPCAWSLGTAPAARSLHLLQLLLTIISFVAQILLFGQVLAQLLLWREEAKTQPPSEVIWLQILFATGFENCNLTRQALGFIVLTPALQSGNERRKERSQGYDILPWHKCRKKEKKSVLMFMFLLGYPGYPLLPSGKTTAEEKAVVGKCCNTNCCTTQRSSSVSRQRNESAAEWFPTPNREKPQLSHR